VEHRELRETAGPQHPRHLTQRAFGISDVHQAHERGHHVECRRAERQRGPVAEQIADTVTVGFGGRRNERLRDIEGDDVRAATGQQAGIMPLTAAHVQARQPVDCRQQFEKRRGVHQVPVEVQPSARQFRPRRGVGVPLPPYIWRRHPAMLARLAAMGIASMAAHDAG